MTELDEVALAIYKGTTHLWSEKKDCVRYVAAQMPGETPSIVNDVADLAYDLMRKDYPHACASCCYPITGKTRETGWTCGSPSCMRDYYN